ncbi:MAG: histidinol-phosphatase HisJ family protein [Candidatus Riflebacteria bacterium]|nr:histidinol-phosphatase HisJ family protein [Candidatus Riflebacteria bacterium]
MITDSHCHSTWSQDGKASPEQMLAAAAERQIDILAITDHADFMPGDSIFAPERYLENLHSIAASSRKVKLICGVELGIQAEHADLCRAFVAGHNFDFIIASMHRARELDFYYGEFYKHHGDANECWKIYLEESLKAVRAFEDFDVFGHLDLIRRYGLTRGTKIPAQLGSELDELLSWLIEHNKGIEINTSGIRYGLESFHPYLEILQRYCQMGGQIVTIGSDSHNIETLGENFLPAVEMLKSCGIQRVAWYKNRQPHFADL